MNTTMIGFGIKENPLKNIINEIKECLIDYKIPFEDVEKKHISIVQISEKVKKDEMVRLVNKVDSEFKFRPKKISVLKGRDFDFITLELNASDGFKELYNNIDDIYEIIKFNNIKPHISLFKIPAGIAGDNFIYDVVDNIQLPKYVNADKVELWGKKFDIEYEKKL